MRILVAAHKPYPMPDDDIYLPVQAGSAGRDSIGYTRDDGGDNISGRNGGYSELTVLYWAWKNLQEDVIGLAHYRRHFSGKGASILISQKRRISVLGADEAKKALASCDIIVPKCRRYFIETLLSHYAHTLNEEHLVSARRLIIARDPDLAKTVDAVYSRTYGYMFNMFIMRRELLCDYCEWLFPILFELEKEFSDEGLSAFEARIFGRVSEILFNIWLEEKRSDGLTVKEIPVVNTEPVNWLKKGSAFLLAKFAGKRYTKSF